jgi:hypothetical protein
MSDLINKQTVGLNNNQLKMIAMISMLIDHIGLILFPRIRILRYIGRLAFPIYSYMIAEGCRYTKNRKRYLGMIVGMAFIFQIVYFIFMQSIYQGILVNFSLSIITIFAIESFINNKSKKNRSLMILTIFVVMLISIGFPLIFSKYGFDIDYNLWGLFLPILVYFAPTKKWRIVYTALLLIMMAIFSSRIQWWSLLCIPLFMLYNEERGNKNLKYIFYIFYPLHLIIIYGIKILITILEQI